MLHDLIDVYYYIRSTDDLQNLEGWSFEDAGASHSVSIIQVWNSVFTEQDWEIKITVGNINDYRQIFLAQTKVEVATTWNYHYAIGVNGFITENEADALMRFISTDEIALMNQIYLEMRKLKNRSCQYERTKS